MKFFRKVKKKDVWNENTGIKKFFKDNPRTVIVILAFFVAGINFLGYYFFMNYTFDIVKVPVAKVNIASNNLLDESNIEYKEVSKSILDIDNIIIDEKELKGKYTRLYNVIPKGSFIYKFAVGSKEEVMSAQDYQIREGKIPYSLAVDNIGSTNNVVKKNNIVDVYFNQTFKETQSTKVMFGKLIENVRILSTYTASNQEVSKGTDVNYLILELSPEELDYIERGLKLGQIKVLIDNDQSNDIDNTKKEYYDVVMVRQFIDSQSIITKKPVAEVTEEKPANSNEIDEKPGKPNVE
ncbi:MAG: RcpC/CpaB family pilus assembly protein [Erysipelotrichaceae bacterium]